MDKRQNVILIVDDTPENLRVLGELLEADSHEVRVATNGPHGLEIAGTSEVDLVLLDIMMPEMDGYEVCQRLKENRATREIPVIFLTALDSPEDEARGLKMGAVDYITKPFKLELVRARVNNHLALHNTRRLLRDTNDHLEELVVERSQELAAAHQRLLTLDSAKYDFLQLIYQKLWAPGRGIIDLSREAMSLADASHPQAVNLRARYEESQSELFDTINNALLMAGTHTGDGEAKASPVRLEVVVADALEKWEGLARAAGVSFETGLGQPPLAAGDIDLVFQVVATVVHAAVLMAASGSSIRLTVSESSDGVELELGLTASAQSPQQWESLFDQATRFHPSDVGKTLGLAVPLAAKIVKALGGRIGVSRGAGNTWTLTARFARFAKKKAVRILL